MAALSLTKDIDTDIEAGRRDEVKHYIEERFGIDYTCSIGTYGTLKLAALIKDFGKLDGIDFETTNKATGQIPLGTKSNLTELFRLYGKRNIKKLIKEHGSLINDLNLALNQPKSESKHACALIITPKDKDIYSWIPVKKMFFSDGSNMLVSEWEGEELDKAGFLKMDFLGLTQLDKFAEITRSLKEVGVEFNIYDYKDKLKDFETYGHFQNGLNQDVFQFGTPSIAQYSKILKPNEVNDLFAMNALHRPGPMENGFHLKYAKRKNGDEEIDYLWGTEEITKDTYGLCVYQEQVSQICQKVGGFDAIEADNIRKAMGKKKMDLLKSYREQFLQGAEERGCPIDEAETIWATLEEFAKYSFNKSHSVAYSIMGYLGQWLKVQHPIHFWKTAISFAMKNSKKESLLPPLISEIGQTGDIQVLPPDVNKSDDDTKVDVSQNKIFWPFSSISGVGEVATGQFMRERNEFNEFFSLEEFIDRFKSRGEKEEGLKVNKTVTEGLIYCGAFDEIEGIDRPTQRKVLIEEYRDRVNAKIDKNKDKLHVSEETGNNWWWTLQQKKLSGIAFFDYDTLIKHYFRDYVDIYYTPQEFHEVNSKADRVKAAIAGYVIEADIKETKKGVMIKILLESNYSFYPVTIWTDKYEEYEEELLDCKKSLMLISGTIRYDGFREENALQTNEKTEIVVLR